MIEIIDIHKSYGNLEILKGVSFSINKGEIVSIVGTSGAGKTTLLNIIGTLDKADSGDIKFDDKSISSLSKSATNTFRNKQIGFVFQFHNLLAEFTSLENICIPAWIGGMGKKEAEEKAMNLLDIMSLKDRATHKPSELSGGEQQRIAVARALINSPQIVLADEPSGNLDSKNKEDLHQLILKLREELNQTFLIVTHDNDLSRMSDRIIRLNDGKIKTNLY